MALSKDHVYATIIQAVTPLTGEMMAKSAVQTHGTKLGLVGATLTADEVEALLSRVGASLNVFIGRDKSAQVVGELQRALKG